MARIWLSGLVGAFQVALLLKNLPVNAGNMRDMGLIPGLERTPGGGSGNPLQCCCLENFMDREAWWAIVHRVAESWTQLKQLSMYACSRVQQLQREYIFHNYLRNRKNITFNPE